MLTNTPIYISDDNQHYYASLLLHDNDSMLASIFNLLRPIKEELQCETLASSALFPEFWIWNLDSALWSEILNPQIMIQALLERLGFCAKRWYSGILRRVESYAMEYLEISQVDLIGAIYFWCCVFGARHCQLYRAGLLPQWRIYYLVFYNWHNLPVN